MYSSLLLSAALIAPTAPIPRDTTPNTIGPAPRVLSLKADASGAVRVVGTIPVKQTVTTNQIVIEGGKQVQKEIEYDTISQQYFDKTLADFNCKFATADGKPLSCAEATARVKQGATVLASADGKLISPAWLRAVAPDTVVMMAEGLSHAQLQWGGETYPTTPAPRLAMLGTDDKGKVQTQVTSAPLNNNSNVYYEEDAIRVQMQIQRMQVIRARGVRFEGDVYYGNQPSNATVVTKPLTDVKFDAYDLTGKLIPQREVLNRLAAGGMVIVAGDNRMPDEKYLKGFHPDMIVLVSTELVLPVTPLDQTKPKKAAAKDPMAAPAIDLPLPPQPPRPVVIQRAVVAPLPAVKGKEKAVERKK